MENQEFLPIPAWLYEEANGQECNETTLEKALVALHVAADSDSQGRAAAMVRVLELRPIPKGKEHMLLAIEFLVLDPGSSRLGVAALGQFVDRSLKI